jgi:hypothetical protein
MKLVPYARRWYRMASIWAMALAGSVQTTWELVPPDLKSGIPPNVAYLVTMALLLFGVIGRLIAQPKVTKE